MSWHPQENKQAIKQIHKPRNSERYWGGTEDVSVGDRKGALSFFLRFSKRVLCGWDESLALGSPERLNQYLSFHKCVLPGPSHRHQVGDNPGRKVTGFDVGTSDYHTVWRSLHGWGGSYQTHRGSGDQAEVSTEPTDQTGWSDSAAGWDLGHAHAVPHPNSGFTIPCFGSSSFSSLCFFLPHSLGLGTFGS